MGFFLDIIRDARRSRAVLRPGPAAHAAFDSVLEPSQGGFTYAPPVTTPPRNRSGTIATGPTAGNNVPSPDRGSLSAGESRTHIPADARRAANIEGRERLPVDPVLSRAPGMDQPMPLRHAIRPFSTGHTDLTEAGHTDEMPGTVGGGWEDRNHEEAFRVPGNRSSGNGETSQSLDRAGTFVDQKPDVGPSKVFWGVESLADAGERCVQNPSEPVANDIHPPPDTPTKPLEPFPAALVSAAPIERPAMDGPSPAKGSTKGSGPSGPEAAGNGPRVHIGRIDIVVLAPEQTPAPQPAEFPARDLASRSYLRRL